MRNLTLLCYLLFLTRVAHFNVDLSTWQIFVETVECRSSLVTRPDQWQFWTGTLDANVRALEFSLEDPFSSCHSTGGAVFKGYIVFVTLQHFGHGDIRNDKMAQFAIVTESDNAHWQRDTSRAHGENTPQRFINVSM